MRCSYCNLACRFAVDTDDLGIIGLNYRDGRLCARGCANEILLKSGRRLTNPVVEFLPTSWEATIKKIKDLISRYQESMVITVGSELTLDEFQLIRGLARALKVRIIPIGLGGGDFQLDGVTVGNLSEIESAERLITFGSLFEAGPIIANSILNFRYRKGTVLYHLDSLPSRIVSFADHFLPLSPGEEAKGLTEVLERKEFASMVADVKEHPTLIIGAITPARFSDPVAAGLALQYLARSLKKKVITITTKVGWSGDGTFEDLIRDVKGGKIKLILNFGDELLYFADLLKGVRLITTTTFTIEPKRGWILLPAAISAEKGGKVRTVGGFETAEPFPPPSGVYPIEKLIGMIATGIKPLRYEPVVVDDDFLFRRIEGRGKKGKGTITLYGVPSPIHFRDLFQRPLWIWLSQKDLVRMRLTDYNTVRVGTKSYSIEAEPRVHPLLPEGVATIPIDSPQTWPLFSFSGSNLIPTEVRLWRGRST